MQTQPPWTVRGGASLGIGPTDNYGSHDAALVMGPGAVIRSIVRLIAPFVMKVTRVVTAVISLKLVRCYGV